MIVTLEEWVGQPLPPAYRAFLHAQTDDVAVGDFVLLYGQLSFAERNQTYETKQYCPGYVTIGDDGGGRQILLSLAAEHILLVDAGSMNSQLAAELATSFSVWLASGCPLPNEV